MSPTSLGKKKKITFSLQELKETKINGGMHGKKACRFAARVTDSFVSWPPVSNKAGDGRDRNVDHGANTVDKAPLCRLPRMRADCKLSP